MDPVTIVMGVLALINQMLPLLGVAAGATGMTGTILQQLTIFLPLIEKAIELEPMIYAGVKNIIAALKNDPNTIPAQMKALHILDAQVDALVLPALSSIDPDAGPAPAA